MKPAIWLHSYRKHKSYFIYNLNWFTAALKSMKYKIFNIKVSCSGRISWFLNCFDIVQIITLQKI